MIKRIADHIVDFLFSKTDHIFTVSGGGCMYLIDALGQASENARGEKQYICMHHEQSVAMAMEGYSRMAWPEKRKIGCGIVTTGPGGINTMNGIAGMWTDSIPAILVSGQVNSNQTLDSETKLRQIGDQEFDIISMVKPITKYAIKIDKDNYLKSREIVERAYFEATTGRPGPVWIDVCLDVQSREVDWDKLPSFKFEATKPITSEIREEVEIKIKDWLRASEKPLLLLGGGVRLSPNFSQERFDGIVSKIEECNIPIAVSIGACDLANDSKVYIGRALGSTGQYRVNRAIQECDRLFAIGSRLNIRTTAFNFESFAEKAAVIKIDIDEAELYDAKLNIRPDFCIAMDSIEFLEIFASVATKLNYQWLKECLSFVLAGKPELKENQIYRLMEYLSKLEEFDLPVIASNGSANIISMQTLKLKKNQRLFTNTGCASMGYGLPAAIGACFANGKRPVACFEGDGSLMMNLQELQTVSTYELPIKLFLLRNGGYSSIKQTQDSFFEGRRFGSDEKNGDIDFPSFSSLICEFGFNCCLINNVFSTWDKENLNSYFPWCIIFESDPNERFSPKVVAQVIDGKIVPGKLDNMRYM